MKYWTIFDPSFIQRSESRTIMVPFSIWLQYMVLNNWHCFWLFLPEYSENHSIIDPSFFGRIHRCAVTVSPTSVTVTLIDVKLIKRHCLLTFIIGHLKHDPVFGPSWTQTRISWKRIPESICLRCVIPIDRSFRHDFYDFESIWWVKIYASIKNHHLRQIDSVFRLDLSLLSFSFLGNTFQKRRVSSPAPVTIVVPSGFMAKYRTL